MLLERRRGGRSGPFGSSPSHASRISSRASCLTDRDGQTRSLRARHMPGGYVRPGTVRGLRTLPHDYADTIGKDHGHIEIRGCRVTGTRAISASACRARMASRSARAASRAWAGPVRGGWAGAGQGSAAIHNRCHDTGWQHTTPDGSEPLPSPQGMRVRRAPDARPDTDTGLPCLKAPRPRHRPRRPSGTQCACACIRVTRRRTSSPRPVGRVRPSYSATRETAGRDAKPPIPGAPPAKPRTGTWTWDTPRRSVRPCVGAFG